MIIIIIMKWSAYKNGKGPEGKGPISELKN